MARDSPMEALTLVAVLISLSMISRPGVLLSAVTLLPNGPRVLSSKTTRPIVWCLTVTAALFGSNVALSRSTFLQQSFDVQVPWRSMPVTIGGKKLLLYEVHLTNFAPTDWTLTRIQVVHSTGTVLNELKNAALDAPQRF